MASSDVLLALIPTHIATKAAQLNFILMMEPMSSGDRVAGRQGSAWVSPLRHVGPLDTGSEARPGVRARQWRGVANHVDFGLSMSSIL